MIVLVQDVCWALAGALLGAAYFLSLRWNTRLFALGGALALAFAVQLLRFAALGVCLWLIAVRFGAAALLFAVLGLFAARLMLVRRSLSA